MISFILIVVLPVILFVFPFIKNHLLNALPLKSRLLRAGICSILFGAIFIGLELMWYLWFGTFWSLLGNEVGDPSTDGFLVSAFVLVVYMVTIPLGLLTAMVSLWRAAKPLPAGWQPLSRREWWSLRIFGLYFVVTFLLYFGLMHRDAVASWTANAVSVPSVCVLVSDRALAACVREAVPEGKQMGEFCHLLPVGSARECRIDSVAASGDPTSCEQFEVRSSDYRDCIARFVGSAEHSAYCVELESGVPEDLANLQAMFGARCTFTDVNVVANGGMTPLLFALSHSMDESVIQSLVEQGADVNAGTAGYLSALRLVLNKGYSLNTWNLLIEYGADMEHQLGNREAFCSRLEPPRTGRILHSRHLNNFKQISREACSQLRQGW